MVYTSPSSSYRLISGKISSRIPVTSSSLLDSTTFEVKLLTAIRRITEIVTIIARKTTGYALFDKIFLSIFLFPDKTKWFYSYIFIHKGNKSIHNKYGKTYPFRHIAEIPKKNSEYSQANRKYYPSIACHR